MALDQQRNIDTVRLANKTTIRLDNTTIEFGVFGVDRHLMHPIFQWLDYRYQDYGVASPGQRMIASIGGFRNVLVAGVNVLNGRIDNKQYQQHRRAERCAGLVVDRSLEEHLGLSRELVLCRAQRRRHRAARSSCTPRASAQDRFLNDGDQSGATSFDLWSPKVGLLWNIDPTWQAYANVSRSAEVPSFGESVSGAGLPSIPFTASGRSAQRPMKIGTRGRRPDLTWELTGYRAEITRRAAVPLQRVRQLQRHQCRSHGASGHRGRSRHRRAEGHCSRGRAAAGPAVAQRGLHVERLPLRQ